MACSRLSGSYALGAQFPKADPAHIVAAKNGGSPMILGVADRPVLPRERHSRDPSLHARDDVSRGRAFCRPGEDGVQIVDGEGRPVESRVQDGPVGSRLGGEGRLRPLHAEGDLRAAESDHGHDRDPCGSRQRRCRPRRHLLQPGRGREDSAGSRWWPAGPRITRAWWAAT